MTTMPDCTTRANETEMAPTRFACGDSDRTLPTWTFGPLVGMNDPVAVAKPVVGTPVAGMAMVPLMLETGPDGDFRSVMMTVLWDARSEWVCRAARRGLAPHGRGTTRAMGEKRWGATCRREGRPPPHTRLGERTGFGLWALGFGSRRALLKPRVQSLKPLLPSARRHEARWADALERALARHDARAAAAATRASSAFAEIAHERVLLRLVDDRLCRHGRHLGLLRLASGGGSRGSVTDLLACSLAGQTRGAGSVRRVGAAGFADASASGFFGLRQLRLRLLRVHVERPGAERSGHLSGGDARTVGAALVGGAHGGGDVRTCCSVDSGFAPAGRLRALLLFAHGRSFGFRVSGFGSEGSFRAETRDPRPDSPLAVNESVDEPPEGQGGERCDGSGSEGARARRFGDGAPAVGSTRSRGDGWRPALGRLLRWRRRDGARRGDGAAEIERALFLAAFDEDGVVLSVALLPHAEGVGGALPIALVVEASDGRAREARGADVVGEAHHRIEFVLERARRRGRDGELVLRDVLVEETVCLLPRDDLTLRRAEVAVADGVALRRVGIGRERQALEALDQCTSRVRQAHEGSLQRASSKTRSALTALPGSVFCRLIKRMPLGMVKRLPVPRAAICAPVSCVEKAVDVGPSCQRLVAARAPTFGPAG